MRTMIAGATALLLLLSVGCSGGGDAEDGSAVEGDRAAPDGAVEPADEGADDDTDDDADDDAEFDAQPGEAGSWTVLVYSMADNDLEPFMLPDVAEMAAVGSGDGVNLVALVDRAAEYTDEPLLNLDDWESAKVLEVAEGELVEVEDLGEVDMADPATLASFITSGIQTYPADRYALVISDHGGGWTGIGPDESSFEVLGLDELSTAIGTGLADAGLDRLDLLGFDACLMATYEVASTMAPFADLMLASEELEPGHGWDYTSLSVLREDPATDAVTLGQALVDGFEGQASAEGTGLDITLSLVDLTGMPALDDAMGVFAAALTEQAAALGPLIGRELADGVGYGRNPDPSQDSHLTDLGVFVSEIGVESLQVSDAADGVLRAINDVVLHQTVGPARLGSTGLSIYFPPTGDLLDPGYASAPVVGPWLQFLDAYHGAGSSLTAEDRPVLADPAAEQPVAEIGEVAYTDALVEDVDGGVYVSVQLDPASLENVVDARVSFGFVDPEDGAIVQLGDTEADIFDDGTVGGFTDLTVLTLTDVDGDSIDAYLSLDFDEESGLAVATVPLDLVDQETGEFEPVDLSLVIEGDTILQEVYYLTDEASGTTGELSPDPTALISPVVLVFADGPGEWAQYGDQGVFADLPNLQYGFESLEAGTEIYVDVVVTDFGGNELIASATFVLE